MTNGEKFREIFSISQVDEGELYAYMWLPSHDAVYIPRDWWNAEYKEPVIRDNGVKNELNRVKNELEPTTKNDLPHCQHTDEEIAKSFIEDVEAVKDQLPCGQMMDFPNTFDEFVKDYGFKDKKEIYTNGSELIQVFRVKQWLEHISTPKNDLVVDCIDRANVIDRVITYFDHIKKDNDEWSKGYDAGMEDAISVIKSMPSVTPQGIKGYWIDSNDKGFVYHRIYKCSHCGATVCEYPENMHESKYKYCSSCGSRNEVEE